MSHEENKANGGNGGVISHHQQVRHDSTDHIPQAPIDHFEPLHPIENEITFQKRIVPKQRTQSVQSVLSSVSLKSFVHQKQAQQQQLQLHQQQNQQHQQQNQQNQQQQSQQQLQQNQQQSSQSIQPAQAQFISAKTHIQAPATAASSKRRASFEIGQRLPFDKDSGKEDTTNAEGEGENALESDDDTQQEQQKKLTNDALKRLSSFGKFTPAEVDMTITTKAADEEEIQRVAQEKIDTNIPFRTSSASQLHMMRPLSAQSSRALSRNMSNLSPVQHSDIDDDIQGPTTTSNNNDNNNANNNNSAVPLLPQTNHIANDYPRSNTPSNVASPGKMHITLPPNNDIISSSMVPTPSSNSSIDNANLKTINDPKRPMYVPAVLRQSFTNLKPEDVDHINEQNSRKLSKSLLQEAAQSIRSQSSHWSLRLDGSSSNSPTRAHWRRDVSRSSCALCDKPFSFFERRHHCRRCGDIFCAEHTSHLLKLGLDAQFTLGGKGLLCKVCDGCCKEYEVFVKRELGESAPTSNGVRGSGAISGLAGIDDQSKQGNQDGNNVVGVVPADWSWSSF